MAVAERIVIEDQVYVTVPEFARITNRYPNQIYDLVNKGNRFRKLKSIRVENKPYVALSEADEFPFNEAAAVRIQYEKKLADKLAEIERLKEQLND